MTDLTKLRKLQAIIVDVDDEHSPEEQESAWTERAALATHLLPLAEALAKVHARDFLTDGHDCAKNTGYPMCNALKTLTEALDE